MKKFLINTMLLLVICWVFNAAEYLLTPPHEISLKDIVTLQSFAFSILTIMALNYVNHEKG